MGNIISRILLDRGEWERAHNQRVTRIDVSPVIRAHIQYMTQDDPRTQFGDRVYGADWYEDTALNGDEYRFS